MRECQAEDCSRAAITRGYCEMHYRRVLKTGKPGPPGPLRKIAPCKAPDCEEPVDAKGLCHGHYQRLLRKNVEDLSPLRKQGPICSLDTCDRPHKAKGFCGAHYARVLAHGDPLADVPIRVANGQHLHHGYVIVPVPREIRHLTGGERKIAEHRLVMAKHLGRALAPDEQVHHINGVRTDNRLDNLELWSTSHPSGRRIEDLLEFCWAMIERYGTEASYSDAYGFAQEARKRELVSNGKNPR